MRTLCEIVPVYLADADVVASWVFNNGRVVVDVQDVDGEREVRVPGGRAVVHGAHLQQHTHTREQMFARVEIEKQRRVLTLSR